MDIDKTKLAALEGIDIEALEGTDDDLDAAPESATPPDAPPPRKERISDCAATLLMSQRMQHGTPFRDVASMGANTPRRPVGL